MAGSGYVVRDPGNFTEAVMSQHKGTRTLSLVSYLLARMPLMQLSEGEIIRSLCRWTALI